MTSQSGYSSQMVSHLPLDSDVIRAGNAPFLHGPDKPILLGLPVFVHDAPRSDQHLVDAARSGCRAAFTELWNLYARRIYLTAFKIVKNPDDAEDALQDAFLRAFVSIGTFEERASFYTWLTRIAINSALCILRKRRRKPETSLDSPTRQEEDHQTAQFKDLSLGPEEDLGRQQQSANLKKAIHRLPAGLREVVHTMITEDCSVKEVARRLNISYAAAKSRLYRARSMMSSSIAARYGARTQSRIPVTMKRTR